MQLMKVVRLTIIDFKKIMTIQLFSSDFTKSYKNKSKSLTFNFLNKTLKHLYQLN